MYCPSCGAESTLELNYCNRCGANLAVPSSPGELAPISLTKPIVAVGLIVTVLTLGGFVILMAGAGWLASILRNSDPLVALIFMGMATLIASDIMLLRLLSRIVRSSLDEKPRRHIGRAAAAETPRQLSPHLEPVPIASVTDHTTRTFSPAKFHEASDRGTK